MQLVKCCKWFLNCFFFFAVDKFVVMLIGCCSAVAVGGSGCFAVAKGFQVVARMFLCSC